MSGWVACRTVLYIAGCAAAQHTATCRTRTTDESDAGARLRERPVRVNDRPAAVPTHVDLGAVPSHRAAARFADELEAQDRALPHELDPRKQHLVALYPDCASQRAIPPRQRRVAVEAAGDERSEVRDVLGRKGQATVRIAAPPRFTSRRCSRPTSARSEP